MPMPGRESMEEFVKQSDLVFIWAPPKGDSFIIKVVPGGRQDTRLGQILHDDLIGKPFGSWVYTNLGKPFCLLRPNIQEFSRRVRRQTQILYPKDIGFILVSLNIFPGALVVECGTGSGSLTSVLAHFVGDTGKVVSYEKREEFSQLARRNCEKWGVVHRVDFKIRDIADGFDERGADAVFLDLPNPWDHLDRAKEALAPGNRLGILVPTVNQVEKVLDGLVESCFSDIQVSEILLRYYKTNSRRIRPEDTMIGHTGYLVFASNVIGSPASHDDGGNDLN
jgi:tRNA (adenine57-N1/adenine58-N1)-methyltransferase